MGGGVQVRSRVAAGVVLVAVLGCGGLVGDAAPDDPAAYACAGEGPDCAPDDPLSIETLMGMALGSPALSRLLREDDDLREDAHIRMNQRLKDGAALDWATQGSLQAVLDAASGLEPVVADLVIAARVRGADPGEWQYVVDSTGEDACGRGPLGLTYRQARQLGLDPLQPSAVVKEDVANGDDVEAKRVALEEATRLGGDEPDLEGRSLVVSEPVRGTRVCLFTEGPDARTDPAALGAMLAAQLGPDAASVRPVGDPADPYVLSGRLAKLFASDLPEGFPALSFDAEQRIDDLLANQDVSRDGRRHVTGEVGHAIGSAVALRCRKTQAAPEGAEPVSVRACDELLARLP
jgi:hypothetical protein